MQAAVTVKAANRATPAIAAHWPEYLMEGAELGTFMMSACLFGVVLGHPASPVVAAVPSEVRRRVMGGLAMGITAVSIIYSPWGKRSGAHMNPAVTLAFLTLGKIAGWDAFFYIAAQFAGGLAGVAAAHAILGGALADARVNYVATVPGWAGTGVAFAAEFLISFLLMTVVLRVSNSVRFARWTPLCAGFLVATYISIEAPLSGMSMNPARTLGSAIPASAWNGIWIYFLAPPAAMLLAGSLYVHRLGAHLVFCAKLHHHNDQRCIFRCNYGALHHGE